MTVIRGRLHEFMAQDHRRIDALLGSCDEDGCIDATTYEAFRGALLRHIGMEEKILLPAARRQSGGEPLLVAPQLKADHAALAALLVPTPTTALVEQIRTLLSAHNPLEEDAGGLYDACDRLAGYEAERILDRLRAAPEVPLARHYDGERAFQAIERLLGVAARLRDSMQRPRVKCERSACCTFLLVHPRLPEWLPEVTLRRPLVGHRHLDVRFWRDGLGKNHWRVLDRQGPHIFVIEQAGELRDATRSVV